MESTKFSERHIPRLRFPVALAGSNITGMETPTIGVAVAAAIGIGVGVGVAIGAAIGIALHKGNS